MFEPRSADRSEDALLQATQWLTRELGVPSIFGLCRVYKVYVDFSRSRLYKSPSIRRFLVLIPPQPTQVQSLHTKQSLNFQLSTKNPQTTTKMSCILTQNPGFEAGLTGYYPSENTIAYVATNPDVAYAGNNFLYSRCRSTIS
jgi:hypothetical protein